MGFLRKRQSKKQELRTRLQESQTPLKGQVSDLQVPQTPLRHLQVRMARSLIETQKLSIKMLQDELGEEAEFDAEETVHEACQSV